MFRNFLVTGWRNLVRNKFYSTLNLVGLAIGLAVGIMILLWVQDELSYDKFHRNKDRLYKIHSIMGSGADQQIWTTAPAPLANMAKKVPEIENVVRLMGNWENSRFQVGTKVINAYPLVHADSTFFDVFDFKIVAGNQSKPFAGSHSVVITETVANRLFGNDDPLGKIIVADKNENFVVSAVIEDFPQNSSLKYEMIFPMSLRAERFGGNGDWKTIDEDLGNYVYDIYLLIKPGADATAAVTKLSKVYEETRDQPSIGKAFGAQRLPDIHLVGADGNTSAKQTVNIFILVAALILLIASINYVNLSTARAILRSKEVSVRKIIGAERKVLFTQFLFESALLFLLSIVLAFGIIRLLLPLYNEVSGKQLEFSISDYRVWILLLGTVTASMAAASIYPAILLSSFNPIDALKGKLSSRISNTSFRRVLVVTQFVFSAALIAATMVVGLQLKYIREIDLGYNKEHVFSFPASQGIMAHADAVAAELSKLKGVSNVATGDGVVNVSATTGDTDWEGKDPNRTFLIHPISIDEEFIPLFRMELKEGKNFTGSVTGDSAKIILNETAVKQAGIKDPIGKQFTLWDVKGTIIGVVKDFNYASLKQHIEPAAFYYRPANWRFFIKTTGQNAKEVIAGAEAIWKKYSADYPFNYSFVDDDYNNLYRAEQRTSVLFNVFAIVAIAISCLGLFGLAAYTAQVKRREVGIRKVLGASVPDITMLLAKDFLKLVLISLLIALPLAWWAMNSWLEDFAYRIDLSWWIFAAAALVALLIAFATVSFQALRAALVNPVNVLKEE